MELKSLYFNLVYVFLFSAKTRIYKQNNYTYTQSGAEDSISILSDYYRTAFSPIYQNYHSLSVSRTVSQLIMRVQKPTVAYKLALQ